MLVALYIGNHAKDTPAVRLGWALTRLAQKGDYARVTHCEAILGGTADSAIIASSSLRDGGVRVKHGVKLDPASWLIASVPMWDGDEAMAWFFEHMNEPYDWRGAWALFMPGHFSHGWFCNASVLACAGFKTPKNFSPAQFAAICFSLGRDVTADFFKQPQGGLTQ